MILGNQSIGLEGTENRSKNALYKHKHAEITRTATSDPIVGHAAHERSDIYEFAMSGLAGFGRRFEA